MSAYTFVLRFWRKKNRGGGRNDKEKKRLMKEQIHGNLGVTHRPTDRQSPLNQTLEMCLGVPREEMKREQKEKEQD